MTRAAPASLSSLSSLPLSARASLIEAVAASALQPAPLDALCAALPAEDSPSAPMMAWGMAQALSQWRAPKLLDAVRLELPDHPGRAWIPPQSAGWVLAGTAPPVGFQAVMWGWLLGAEVWVRPASALAPAWGVWLDIVTAAAPALGAATHLRPFDRRDDAAARDLCARVEVLSVYGDDATVSRWRGLHGRVVAHGHRVSAAYIRRDALRDAARWPALACGIARDLCAWDQLGCLSPVCLLVDAPTDDDDRRLSDLLALLHSQSLPDVERAWPAGTWSVGTRAARGAFIRAQAVLADPLQTPTAALLRYPYQPADRLRASESLHRVLPVQTVRGGDAEALGLLSSLSPHLSCLGLATAAPLAALTDWTHDLGALARGLTAAGLNRVCPIGEMQAPPLTWRHDGLGTLRPLTAPLDLEDAAP